MTRVQIGLAAARADLESDPGTPPLNSPLAFTWWLFKKQPGTLLIGAVAAVFSSASLAIWPYTLGIAIERLEEHEFSAGGIMRWSLVLLAVLLIHVGANLIHHRLSIAAFLRASLRCSRLLGHHAARVGGAIDTDIAAGEVVTAVATDTERMGDFFSALTWFLGAVFAYFTVAIALLTTSIPLGIIVIAGMPIVLAILALVVRPLQRRQADHRSALGDLTTLGSDTVAGLRVLRGIGGEDEFLNRYRQQSTVVRDRGIAVARPQSLMDSLEVALPGLFLAGIMLYASLLAVDGDISIGALIAVYGMAGYLAVPLRTANQCAQVASRALVAARKIIRILQTQPHTREASRSVRAAAVAKLDTSRDLVDGSSKLRVSMGKFTAVVCSDPEVSARAVTRLGRFDDRDAPSARVYWGDVALRDLPLERVRTEIVVSHAMPHLFSGAILQSIDPRGVENAPDRISRVTSALWHADATDVVEQLPSRFADHLAEQGRSLSGGQRQRLALARALLAESRVLVLVEPTSAVDAHSESRIAERVRASRAGKTTVIASASPLILEHADVVVLLDAVSGAVAARGTHRELLHENADYRAAVERVEAEI